MEKNLATSAESTVAISLSSPPYIPPILVSEADHVDARIGPFFQAEVPEWKNDSSSSTSSFPSSIRSKSSPNESISTAMWCLHMRKEKDINTSSSFTSLSSTESKIKDKERRDELRNTPRTSSLSIQDRLLSEVSSFS
jgi:hypothetical protein